MFCSKCGAQLVPGAAFCSTCGAAVVAPPPVGQATPPPTPLPPPLIPRTHFNPPSAPTAPFVETRPVIVTVLAVLQFIGGAVWLLMGLASAANPSGVEGAVAMITAAVFVTIGVAQIFCGLGLLRLKPYGRTLQLIFAALGLLALPIGTIISILILIYLNKPGIKLIFAGRPGDDFTEQEIAEINTDTKTSGVMIAIIAIVGVLLILMIAGVMAAIAVPALLRARISGNEAVAISSLRAVSSAQATYSSNCGQGGFAVSLEDLAKPGPGANAFIDADLGRSDAEKSGYLFNLTRDRSPAAADVGTAAATCNGSSSNPSSSYFATAEPVTPGTTGIRYFAVDGRGAIYSSTHPISNPIMDSSTVTPIR